MILAPYCFVINILSEVSQKISSRIRNVLLHAALLLLLLTGTVNYFNDRLQELMGYESDRVRLFTTVLLIVLLIALIDRKIDAGALRANKLFWTGWFVCFLTIFVLSFVNPVKPYYLLWCILSLTVFPMIMIVLSERQDAFAVSILIARDAVIVSYIFFAANLIITPFVTKDDLFVEYQGVCNNPNSNGLICTAFFTAALYLLAADRRNSFVYLLSLTISASLATISGCRTAQLAMLLEAITLVIICLVHREIHIDRSRSLRLILALIVAVLLGIAAGKVLMTIDAFDMNAYASSEYEETNRWMYEDENRFVINSLLSGRLFIWKAYSLRLNLLGNGSPDGPLMPEYPASKWAHNNAIDIWFASGFFAFAGYMLWLLAAFIFVIRCMKKKQRLRPEYILTSLAFIGYFIQAMLEITLYPMTNCTAFLCIITLGAVAFKQE